MSSASVDPARAAESNLGRILGINTSFHVLALIFVGLRTYTRLAVVRSFGRDDLMILIAIVSCIFLRTPRVPFLHAGRVSMLTLVHLSQACAFFGGMITYIIAAYHGLGRHANTISDEDYKEYLRMTFIQAIVSTIGALAFLKLSVGFALLRLNQSRRYTQVIWAMIGRCTLILIDTCTMQKVNIL